MNNTITLYTTLQHYTMPYLLKENSFSITTEINFNAKIWLIRVVISDKAWICTTVYCKAFILFYYRSSRQEVFCKKRYS